ncbi:3beta-hydroxysteroid-dehydrogenase/decarboxylase [Silene latifolia]|uniref:3beta-hydroxysteroid- dehydrogenase/decarboxylase n=1 Tax=Silene latifolia TaxID=37657 RepID=UPI003D76CEEB
MDDLAAAENPTSTTTPTAETTMETTADTTMETTVETTTDVKAEKTAETCVVIGGNGFIGKCLVLRLLQLGNWIVRVADSSSSIDPHLSHHRASYLSVDLRDYSQLRRAVDGSSVVFFVETTDASTFDLYESYKSIVQGAKNVVNACRDCKVRRLVYNSSADIVFDGSHHLVNVNESMPYPWQFVDKLTELKAQAESLVLFANDYDGLLTCVIRPSNVFGPSDTHLVKFMLSQANSVWAKFILGDGNNLSDFTYVENVAHAHICAAEAIVSQTDAVAGKAFFITNREPWNYWELVQRLYEGLGYQRPSIRIPSKLVSFMLPLVRWARYKLGSETELCGILMPAQFVIESSVFTRFVNCSAARKHINYSPVVPMEEGIALTVKSFSHLAKGSITSRESQVNDFSKAEEILGYGKVADVLLWRDEMESFSYFLVTCGFFYWFFLSGRTFISSTAGLLLLATLFLIVNNILPVNIFQKFPLPCFEISEGTVRNMLDNVASIWSEGVQVAQALAQGEDWSLFLKAAIPLYMLKMIVSHSVVMLVGAVLIFAFTSFFTYEQYEEEVDNFIWIVVIVAKSSLSLLLRSLPPSITSFFSDEDESDYNLAQPPPE